MPPVDVVEELARESLAREFAEVVGSGRHQLQRVVRTAQRHKTAVIRGGRSSDFTNMGTSSVTAIAVPMTDIGTAMDCTGSPRPAAPYAGEEARRWRTHRSRDARVLMWD